MLDMSMDVAENFEGVAYRDITLAEVNVLGRIVRHAQIWYELFEGETEELSAMIKRSTGHSEISNHVTGEGHERTRAIEPTNVEVGVVGHSVHDAECPMPVYAGVLVENSEWVNRRVVSVIWL